MEYKSNHIAEKVAVIVGIILYLGTVLVLAYLSDTNLFRVFVAMMPLLLYIIVLFYFLKLDVGAATLWVLPVLFPLIFIILWYSKSFSLLDSMDGPVITVINIVVSYIINVFVLIAISIGSRERSPKVDRHQEHRMNQVAKELHNVKSQLETTNSELEETKYKLHESKKEIMDVKKELVVSKENFNVTLRSIEDKCKAINFVVGRVYSDKRGASEDIRSKLRISSELYNAFSDITTDFKEEDAEKLYSILTKIRDRLSDIELAEKKLFVIGKATSPVNRNWDGDDRILDVMKNNDKDPISDYHSEAKEICDKLLKFLKESYIKK